MCRRFQIALLVYCVPQKYLKVQRLDFLIDNDAFEVFKLNFKASKSLKIVEMLSTDTSLARYSNVRCYLKHRSVSFWDVSQLFSIMYARHINITLICPETQNAQHLGRSNALTISPRYLENPISRHDLLRLLTPLRTHDTLA